jgi:hypothetical protein
LKFCPAFFCALPKGFVHGNLGITVPVVINGIRKAGAKGPMIKALMEEYGLEIDDIRYYLSFEKANSLLTYKEDPEALAREIWSGRLADALYDMEERFLQSAEENLGRRQTDEASFRDRLSEAAALKALRQKRFSPSPVQTEYRR